MRVLSPLSLLAAIAVMTVFVLAGCAKQSQESASAPSESQAAQPSTNSSAPRQEPESASPKGGVELPEIGKQVPSDFPVPVYEGFVVKDVMQMGLLDKEIIQVIAVGDAAPETVAQFYEAEFKKRGLQILSSTKQEAKGTVTLVMGNSDQSSITATVSKEGNQTQLTLSWSKPKS